MIGIKGKVTGIKEVSTAFGKAPRNFTKGVLGSLLTERDMFVGKRGRDGTFTKKLMRKTSLHGNKWPRNIARIFGGRVDGGERFNGMKLVMGVGESKRSKYRNKAGYGIGTYQGIPFPQVMEFLNVGGLIAPKTHQFMIIPIYRNLPNGGRKARSQWKAMLANKSLEFVRDGARLYYFKKNGTGDDRDLMFIGVRRAVVGRQYNFEGSWSRRLPGVYNRLGKRVDRIVTRINKGKLYG